MRKNKLFKLKAFSMLELTMTVIIITVLIAGILAANGMINRARIATAKSLTLSSPVSTTPDSVFWFESSTDTSFPDGAATSGSGVDAWHDSRSSADKVDASPADPDHPPTYSNTINRIHAIAFNDSTSYYNVSGTAFNDTYYTIFVVEKRLSNKANNYFVGDSSITTANQTLILGYSANGLVIHSQGGSNSYTSNVAAYEDSSGQARVFSFVSSATGKKTYINGILAGQSSDTTKLSGITTLAIGKGYVGEIGELASFSRALSDAERQDIEKYLSKKWSEPSKPGTSCLYGKVDGSGCNVSTCSVSLTGTSTTSVAIGSGSVSCNSTGYTGSVSYSCTDGLFTPSGSCSCASGYTAVSGICQRDCAVSGIAGVTTSSVTYGSGSLSCTDTGYSGSVSYTCTTGTLTPSGSCSCATGYTTSSGTCIPITCSFSGTSGVTNGTSVNYTSSSTSQSCDVSGYSGSVNYTCTAAGAPSVTGSCTAITCAFSGTTGVTNGTSVAYTSSSTSRSCDVAGYTGSVNYTCIAAGAPTVSGSCTAITCAFSGTAGVTNGTSVAYASSSTSRSCDATGYTGSVNYTCTAVGAPTVSGSCTAITCTFSGTAGVTDGTSVAYASSSTSQSCDASGYSGSVNYTCTAVGAPSVTGSCTASSLSYHWVLTTVVASGSAKNTDATNYSSLTCNSSNVNKYAFSAFDVTLSGEGSATLTGGSHLRFYDCFCLSTISGCSTCTGVGSTNWGVGTKRYAQCVYN